MPIPVMVMAYDTMQRRMPATQSLTNLHLIDHPGVLQIDSIQQTFPYIYIRAILDRGAGCAPPSSRASE